MGVIKWDTRRLDYSSYDKLKILKANVQAKAHNKRASVSLNP